MSLQRTILRQYKEAYPGQSLKQISETTGIQVTRVFRLFRGSTMRLREYEAMYQAVLNKGRTASTLDSQFLDSARKAASILNPTFLNEIQIKLENQMRLKSIK